MAGGYSSRPDGMAAIVKQLADLQRQVNELRSAAGIRSAVVSSELGTVRIRDGQIVVEDGAGNVVATLGSTIDVQGAASFGGDTHIGGTLDVSGDSTFSGNMAVTGTLSLPAGIIDNDALANPVLFDGAGGSTTSAFSLSTTAANKIVVNNTVPAGCTKMASFCWGGASAVNSRTVVDYLWGRVTIAGFIGNSLYARAEANSGLAHVSCSKYGLLTGLTPGDTVQHTLQLWANGGSWASSGSNYADLQVVILWGR